MYTRVRIRHAASIHAPYTCNYRIFNAIGVLPKPNRKITVSRKVLCPCLRPSEIISDPNASRSAGSGPPRTIENTRIAHKELPLAENAARCGKVCKELSHLPAIEKPVDTHPLESSVYWRFPSSHGRTFRWTLSRAYRDQRITMLSGW